MPGERVEDALQASRNLAQNGISSIFTRLGENISDRSEAEAVTAHYLDVLSRIRAANLPVEISVKLTQLGLDLDPEFCYANLEKLAAATPEEKKLWIDIEQSPYVSITLDLYRRLRGTHHNVGVCVQAYLYRTEKDVEALISAGAAVRLVKGAYNEPSEIAFPRKHDVTENFFCLAQKLLSAAARESQVRAAIATHDRALIGRLTEWAASQGIEKRKLEFQMLYGIQRAEQLRLAKEGYRSGVLIAYGDYWYPWFMRRLAERPANLWFLARNLFSN
jgi:proline dehydrogenase